MEIIKQTKKAVKKAVQTEEQKVNRKVLSIFIGCTLLVGVCVGANAAVQPLTLLSLENNFSSAINAYNSSMDVAKTTEDAFQAAIQTTQHNSELLCNAYRALKALKEQMKEEIKQPTFNPCTQMRGYGVQVEVEKPAVTMSEVKQFKVIVTSYNPTVAQNDSSPCVGASGKDQCELAKKGIKMLAISRDLRGEFMEQNKDGTFKYPAPVFVESDNPSIQGCYWITDTLSSHKFKGTPNVTAIEKQIDLFFLDKKDNQGGEARISNKIENCSQEFLNQL